MESVFLTDFPQLLHASHFTKSKLSSIRSKLSEVLSESKYSEEITIIATGSYGRGEASEESDLDLYVLFGQDQPATDIIPDELKRVGAILDEEVPNSVGDSGTFGVKEGIKFSDMLVNIGGQRDNNLTLTRRMLFLLEGTWLFGEENFIKYQRQLLEKYIKSSDPDGKISKFLLNDIIRYYRTIATDFEFKTFEANKEWGLRNIKLRFSRKLLYFGGIVVVAETAQHCRDEKLDIAERLFSLPVLERIASVSGPSESKEILGIYENFVEKISDENVRQKLKEVKREGRNESEEFKELRSLGEEFSFALSKWLQEKYPREHPIHHSLLF